MKVVLQRVSRAAVRVDGREVGAIGTGVLVLLGIVRGDGRRELDRLVSRVARFRFFPDEDDRMNRSLLDVAGEALVVSQFTLSADGRKGRRPSFDAAAPPGEAEVWVEAFVRGLEAEGIRCATGVFGARMEVELVNDGPVTFVLDEPPTGGSAGRS